MSETTTLETMTETTATPSRRERRLARDERLTARLASVSAANTDDRSALRAQRTALGVEGREGYLEWAAERREAIRQALAGADAEVTLTPVATGRGTVRVLVSGVVAVETTYGPDTVAIRGETSVRDVAVTPGATTTVRLTLETTRMGAPMIVATGRGMSSLGCHLPIRCRVLASRHVRTLASAL